MKMSLKRYLDLFTQLHNRLSSVRWTLLLITTVMFFLSAASTGCPTGGYTLSVAPNLGPSVSNPPPSSNDQLPPPLPASQPPAPATIPASQLPASATTPAIPVVIPATPEGSGALTSPAVTAPSPSGTTDPPPGGEQVVMVKMVLDAKNPSGFGFSPAKMTIKKGTKVTWVNVTAIPHTVTSDDGKFQSSSSTSPVLQDQMYSFVFATAGTFKYHCAIHPLQIGTITVQ